MNTKARVRSFWLTLILFALAACGGGGGGGGGGPGGGGPTSPIADISGTWTVTEQGVSNCEGEETFSRGPYQVTVTQTGNNLTVVTTVGTFSGTINGDKVSWAGSYPEQGGTTTINSMTLTVAADGNSFSGSSTWSWSDGTESCSGTTQATNGTRVPGTGPVPLVPTGLTATAQSSSAIALNWNPGVVAVAAEVDAPASGYKIERSLSPDSGFAQVGFVATNTTTYTDTGLNPNTLYYYRVRAYNGRGDSAYSNVANAMTLSTAPGDPAAPSGLTATATSSSSVKLSWTDNSSNETGFKIERSTSATSGFVQIGMVGANIVSYTNTGLADATTYYYRVRATNAAGDSPYSNTANALTPPAVTAPSTPSNLVASTLSTSSIKLTWTDNSSNETGFKIERSTSATTGFSQIGVVAANVATFTNTGLSASTTYYYRVRATNTSVIPALDSAYSNIAHATTQAATAVLRIVNNTHYDMVDIRLNGSQKLIYPNVLSVGHSADISFSSAGTVNFNLGVGFYNSDQSRNVWFTLSGSTSVTLGSTTTITFNNPTIGQLLSVFQSSATWSGIYWNGLVPHTAAYRFASNGTWTFFDDGVQRGTGTVTLVSWPNYATIVTFRFCSTCADITMAFPFASFLYRNGPASWPIIEYVLQP